MALSSYLFRAWLLFAVLLGAPALGQNTHVSVNDNPAAERTISELNALRGAKDYGQAAELLHGLLDNAQHKLVAVDEGRYVDSKQWCRDELHLDVEVQQAYRARYSAVAAREFRKAIQGGSIEEALARVYDMYPVTASGLEAGLHLAGLHLACARSDLAASRIEQLMQHPDGHEFMERLLMLQGAAAVYLRDESKLIDAKRRLIELKHTGQVQWLEQLAASISAAPDPLQPPHGPLANPLANKQMVPVWDKAFGLPDSIKYRRNIDLPKLETLPVMTPSKAMVNNGRQVIAFDRSTGQEAWAYPEHSADWVTRRGRGWNWHDARSIALQGRAVAAVLGESYVIRGAIRPRAESNSLAVIDLVTGQKRWSKLSGEQKENEPALSQDRGAALTDFGNTHFVGTPVIGHGKVVVFLRRIDDSQPKSTLMTCWALCYDLEDGVLLWHRHVASTRLVHHKKLNRLTPRLILHGETVYVTDGVAAIGALNIHSGSYRWLRIMSATKGSIHGLATEQRGAFSPPVMTRSGLIVSLTLQGKPALLINPQDGSLLQDFAKHRQLANTQYVLPARGGAVFVSNQSITFWDDEKSEVLWAFKLRGREQVASRGDVTPESIVIPTDQRTIVLDRQTGQLIAEAESLGAAILVRDNQCLVVKDLQLRMYSVED